METSGYFAGGEFHFRSSLSCLNNSFNDLIFSPISDGGIGIMLSSLSYSNSSSRNSNETCSILYRI